MTFLWSDALWLLVALPALIAAYVAACRRKDTAYLPYVLTLLREAIAPSQRMRRHAPPLIFFLGVAAAFVAAARPALLTTVAAQQGTVILAIDASLSMAATDVAPTRLAAAQAAMASFVKAQPRNVRIGIVAFGGTAHVVQSPTVNKRDVLAALDRLALQEYTAIGTALITAVLTLYPNSGTDNGDDLFRNGWEAAGPRVPLLAAFHPVEKSRKRITTPTDFSTAIILVSDGCETTGVSPVKAAEIAAEHGIRVYSVGVGTPYGGTASVAGLPPIHAEFREDVLREIARITRGEYFHARNAGRLNTIYDRLTRQAVLESMEVTVPLVLIAVTLLVAASVLALVWQPLPIGGARPKTLW